MKHYVFVYGTLRRGYGNHRLLENSKFIGEGITKEKYMMIARGIPYVVKEPLTPIKGELYEVDDETLERLDYLEGHPTFYTREKTEVIVNRKTYDAWLYFNNNIKDYNEYRLVETGDYRHYKDYIYRIPCCE